MSTWGVAVIAQPWHGCRAPAPQGDPPEPGPEEAVCP